MVKSIITVIIATFIVVFGAFLESVSLNKTFDEMIICIDQIDLKLEDEVCTTDDILSLQTLWIESKKHLHIYIPHTEIKELDLWISECIMSVKLEKFDEARIKLEVVKELCEQIPKTFNAKVENLF